MQTLCNRIGLPREVREEILKIHRDPDFQPEISGLRQESAWIPTLTRLKEELGEDPQGFRLLCCMLRCAWEAREDYTRLGLSDEIYDATFACFSRFVREHRESYGIWGFDRGFWTVRQVSCKLFRIGQMEYELTELEGKPALSLHIPSDAQLDRWQASWEMARPLLYRIFPEYENAPLFCRSWLLAPELQQLLPPGSRILAFQRTFRIRPLEVSTGGYVRWVFKDTRLTPDQYPENTTLQRSLKAWLQTGGTLTDALGIAIE